MKGISIPVILLLLGTVACDRTRSSTGWDYMPDMYYSNAYETYTPNTNFENGRTMQRPVEGTVPRDMVPFPYKNTDEDRLAAGRELVNPYKGTGAEMERGTVAFETYCMMCHGEKGDGQGYLFTSKKYPYPPANLVSDKVKALKDGEIYHTITVGYGIMGAHGGIVRPEDRWKIILHIRNLQKQTE